MTKATSYRCPGSGQWPFTPVVPGLRCIHCGTTFTMGQLVGRDSAFPAHDVPTLEERLTPTQRAELAQAADLPFINPSSDLIEALKRLERNPSEALPLWRNAPQGAVSGTSLMGWATCPFGAVEAAFGTPMDGDGEKVSTEWTIEVRIGDEWHVATIYDYKELSSFSSRAVELFRGYPTYEWNIGGHRPEVVGAVAALLGTPSWMTLR